jgi:beta-mannosidase
LPKAKTEVEIAEAGAGVYDFTFTSSAFQHRFAFDLKGISHRSSDNYFELYAGETKRVRVTLEYAVPVARLRRALGHRSLVDTY